MITRIRYTKELSIWCSYSIVITSTLKVRIEIDEEFNMKVVEHPNYKTLYLEKCKSLQQAKRKARKKLGELGLNFNNEIRRKA